MEQIETSALTNKYLMFSLKGQTYALGIDNVIEIVRVVELTALPSQPEYLVGVADIRGLVIPVVDVALRIGKSCINNTDRTCIIVVSVDGIQVGLLVDDVRSVSDVAGDALKQPPDLFSRDASRQYLTGIAQTGNSLALVISCDALVADMDLAKMHQINQMAG